MKAAWHFTQGGKTAVVTTDYYRGAGAAGLVSGDAQKLWQAWVDHLAEGQSNECRLDKVVVNTLTGPIYEHVNQHAGEAIAAAAPINTALLVKKQTASTRRGRWFIPGILESQIDAGGNVIGGALEAWTTFLAAFHTDLQTKQLKMNVNQTVGGAVMARDVLGLTPASVVATQRRRMRR